MATIEADVTVEAVPDLSHRLLTELLDRPDRWLGDIVELAEGRAYTKLLDRDEADAWLILWAPGSGLELHDHGSSSASFAVVRGRLVEQHRTRTDPRLHRRTIRRGDRVSFGPDHLHAVENRNHHTAASIHVYSPPLEEMGFPDVDGPALTTVSPTWDTLAVGAGSR